MAARIFFSPHFLIREAGFPYDAVTGLRLDGTVRVTDELASIEARLRNDQEELCAAIYALVPGAEEAVRPALIAAQRDLFNLRPLRPEHRQLLDARLDPATRAALDAWDAQHDAHRALLSQGPAVLEQELQETRTRFAALVADEEFQKGLHLSNGMLLDKAASYARAVERSRGESSGLDKRLRKAEIPLASYVSRMALKPTPFGSFTRLRMGLLGASPADRAPAAEQTTRLVRIARLLLLWIEQEMAAQPEARKHLVIRQNHTCEVRGTTLHFFTRGRDGSLDMLRSESFKRLPLSDSLRVILDVVEREQPCTYEHLVTRICQLGPSAAEAERYLDKLVDIGLLESSLGLVDQERDFLQALKDRVQAIPGPRARQAQDLIAQASALEAEFARASARERAEITGRLIRVFDACAELFGSASQSLGDLRTVFYEDTAVHPPIESLDPAALDAHLDTLRPIQRLLPLFSETLLKQTALVRLFLRCYGDPDACPSLLEFYERYAQVPKEELSALFFDFDDPLIRPVRELQGRFMAYLDEVLAGNPGASEITLDPARLGEIIAAIPPQVLPWESAAYRCQFMEDGQAPTRLVLNSVGIGFGKSYSRFCDLFDTDDGGQVRNPLVDSIRSLNARMPADRVHADLIAVFGINVNLHPSLLQAEVLYPRCSTSSTTAEILKLSDLHVALDARRQCLRLFSRRLGKQVVLVPHNFLFPLAAPRLYQFLYRFGPSAGTPMSFWDRYDAWRASPDTEQVRRFPRLSLGNVVLDRGTWKVPLSRLPPARESFKSDFAYLVEMRRWQRALGLPEEGFVRVRSLPDPFSNAALDMSAQDGQRLHELRHPRERKPQYVDFRSYLLLRALDKHVRESGESMTFQEFLPGGAHIAAARNGGRVREYVFELNMFESDESSPVGGSSPWNG